MTNEFARTLGKRLHDEAVGITARWIELVHASMHYRPRAELGIDTLRDHGPRLVREIGEFVAGSRDRPAEEVLDHLREVVDARHGRGHDVQEVLGEIDLLAEILFETMRDLTGADPSPASMVAETGRRLHRGLTVIGTVTAGLYEEADRHVRRADRERDARFRDDLAHEMKNPLGAALGALQTLHEEDLADVEMQDRMLSLAVRNVRRALELLDDLRNLARGDAPAQATEPRSLQSLVDAVLVEVSEEARRQEVELRVAEPLPDARVDGPRVQLALVNVVWNAVKYSDPDKPERWVEIRASATNRHVDLRVQDNGVGIPADSRDRVFRRFARAHPEHTDGTGLGLPIARDGLLQIGGAIQVDSDEGVGSTFIIRAPIVE
ncbi:MAG TPA: sensor histidine kinase [Longimicrobiales bacterium]|nr:sensor histidine kinase [Longimicrobiales bacterium]